MSNQRKLSMAPKREGIQPDSRLPLKSKSHRLFSAPKREGICPCSRLSSNHITRRLDRAPSRAGVARGLGSTGSDRGARPINRLRSNISQVRLSNAPSRVGISPVSMLPPKFNRVSALMLPIWRGIPPDILLSLRSRCRRFDNRLNSTGIAPDN